MAVKQVHAAKKGPGANRQPVLKAVIFDLDGVVADSHPIHEIAWAKLLVEQGLDRVTLNLDFLYAGHPRRAILKHYLGPISAADMEQLGRRKDELYGTAARLLMPKPRIPETLHELNEDGIACALAASAGRTRTYETLEKFGLTESFATIVTGEEAGTPKPAPEIFLLAARRIETDPKCCVVVEDSVAGVAAARAARMKCVGFAPAKWLVELAEAGADDLISRLPADATSYFRSVLNAKSGEPAARVRE